MKAFIFFCQLAKIDCHSHLENVDFGHPGGFWNAVLTLELLVTTGVCEAFGFRDALFFLMCMKYLKL